MSRKYLLLFLFTICFRVSNGQYVSAYEDYRKYFYVFENGAPRQLETAPVKKYFIAGSELVYINSANELRAWYNGEKFSIGEAANTTINATNNLIYYINTTALTVIDKGELV